MIRVTVEIITFETGSEGQKLLALEIVNDQTGTPALGNYAVCLLDANGDALATGHVKSHQRNQGLLAEARLVAKALMAVGVKA